MKKLIFLGFVFMTMLTSCSLEDNENQGFFVEVMPIETVDMPDHFVHGETYEIILTYVRPTSCYEFNDIIYEINGHERTVAILNTVYNQLDCIDESELVSVTFDFPVTGTETYVFKFFQGQDEYDVDQYYIVEVPVVDERVITN